MLKGYAPKGLSFYPPGKSAVFKAEFGHQSVFSVIRELRCPVSLDSSGTPVKFETENLGFTIYVTVTKSASSLLYFGRAELVDLAADGGKSYWGIRPVLSAKSFFKGSIKSGELIRIPIAAPAGKKAKLELQIKEL